MLITALQPTVGSTTAVPARSAEPESPPEKKDVVTLTWSDQHTSKALKGTLVGVGATAVGAIPGIGQLAACGGLTIGAAVGLANLGAAAGKKASQILFQGERFQKKWETPLMVLGTLTGLAGGAVAGFTLGSMLTGGTWGTAWSANSMVTAGVLGAGFGAFALKDPV